VLQGLHVGFFIALARRVVYWLLLNRTTLGYEVRATGFNPEAARYGGVNVKRSYVLAMAISGTFAGLAGALDILGWQFRSGAGHPGLAIGFIGIAVALLGRNSAIGVPFAALLFGALLQGTSTRNPGDPGRDQAGAGREPDADHPGPRAAVRRRRPVLPLDLAGSGGSSDARRPSRLRRKQERPQDERALTCRPGERFAPRQPRSTSAGPAPGSQSSGCGSRCRRSSFDRR
jgi:hypothetical protein